MAMAPLTSVVTQLIREPEPRRTILPILETTLLLFHNPVVVFPPQGADRAEVGCSKFDAGEFGDLRSPAPVVWAKAVKMRGLASITTNGSLMKTGNREW